MHEKGLVILRLKFPADYKIPPHWHSMTERVTVLSGALHVGMGDTLDRKASILGANPNVKIQISGHADERGSDEYNLALGNRRAAAAKRYLENKGIDGSRIDVVSYGEERPLNPGHDEAAYAQNRRDEFTITSGGDNLVAPQ